MSWTNADLLALKAELTNDPNGLGLTTNPGDDVGNADKLNEIRAGQEVDRLTIPVEEIIQSINLAEFEALSASKRQWLGLVASGESINPKDAGEIKTGLWNCFLAGSVTRVNLIALIKEPVNRIEQLYRAGTLTKGGSVTPSDIADARQAT